LSLVVLYFLGETLNTMTLGGLALAVGILVDESTVTIENTHRLWTEESMPLADATLHSAAEIAVPTLVSTLAISCVFTSVVFLEGLAKYLFITLGLAVVFAMLASYGLSRTLTPITIGLLLKGERRHVHGEVSAGIFSRMSKAFERLRGGYAQLLALLRRRRAIVPVGAGPIGSTLLSLAVTGLVMHWSIRRRAAKRSPVVLQASESSRSRAPSAMSAMPARPGRRPSGATILACSTWSDARDRGSAVDASSCLWSWRDSRRLRAHRSRQWELCRP
jgi:hypothetical protein